MNHLTIVGNLTADPELRHANTGQAVTSFTIAHNRRQKNDDGTWTDGDASFVSCVTFGTLAEAIAEQLTKGQRVIAAGRLQQRSWETPDGDKRSKIELVVDACGPDLKWAAETPRGDVQRASRVTRVDDEAPF